MASTASALAPGALKHAQPVYRASTAAAIAAAAAAGKKRQAAGAAIGSATAAPTKHGLDEEALRELEEAARKEEAAVEEAYQSLTKAQKGAVDAVVRGESILITGGGGVGKSFVINIAVKRSRTKKGKNVCVTATTGQAASQLEGAVTVHSALRLSGLIDQLEAGAPVAEMLKTLQDSKAWYGLCQDARAWHALLIDEMSMLPPNVLELIDALLRAARARWDAPFGGLQLVLVGDFGQLPPVSKGSSDPPLLFESDVFWAAIDSAVDLREVHRQKDAEFVALLNRARIGAMSDEDEELIRTRVDAQLPDDAIKPTRLFPTNDSVDAINTREMKALAPPDITYSTRAFAHETTRAERQRASRAEAEGKAPPAAGAKGRGPKWTQKSLPPHLAAFVTAAEMNEAAGGSSKASEGKARARDFMRDSLVRQVCGLNGRQSLSAADVTLRKDAQVMLTANLDVAGGLVNGSRGKVLRFERTYAQALAWRAAKIAAAEAAKGTPQPPIPTGEAAFGDAGTEETRLYADEPLPVVRFHKSGGGHRDVTLPYVRVRREVEGLGSADVWRLPLKPAWASSLHKSQVSAACVGRVWRGVAAPSLAHLHFRVRRRGTCRACRWTPSRLTCGAPSPRAWGTSRCRACARSRGCPSRAPSARSSSRRTPASSRSTASHTRSSAPSGWPSWQRSGRRRARRRPRSSSSTAAARRRRRVTRHRRRRAPQLRWARSGRAPTLAHRASRWRRQRRPTPSARMSCWTRD